VGEYQKAGVTNKNPEQNKIVLDDPDF